MIEAAPFDLKRGWLSGVMPVAEDELEAFGAVANVELSAGFDGETLSLEGFQHSHLCEELAIIGQERFTDVKARETLLFQNENALSGPRQKGGGAAATGPAANHNRVINRVRHAPIKRQVGPSNKHELSSPKHKKNSKIKASKAPPATLRGDMADSCFSRKERGQPCP